MGPGRLARKLLEEQAGRDGAAAARAHVVQVGDLALEELAVLVDERQLPQALTGLIGGGAQPSGQAPVVGEEPGHERTERHDAGAGQRGEIDHLVRLDLGIRVRDRVGQREPALGVGVADLDRRAVHRLQHVARADRRTRRHVLGRGDEPVDLDRRLQIGERTHDTQHGGGARHVVLHAQHALGRLEIETAGVERDPLADDRDLLARSRRCIREMNEARRLLAARRHAQEGAHAELLALGAVQDFDGEALLLGQIGRGLGQVRRVDVVGRRVDEVAREPRGEREDLAGARALTDLARGAAVGREHDQLGHRLVVLLPLVAVERVGAEDGALHGGVGALARRQAVAQDVDRHAARAEVAGAPHAGRRGAADGLRGQLARLPEPDHDDARRAQSAGGVHVRELGGPSRELLGVEHALDEAVGALVERGEPRRQRLGLGGQPDDQGIGFDVGRRGADHLDLHGCFSASASARWIMSRRPSVTSSPSISSSVAQRASAASVPASIRSESA